MHYLLNLSCISFIIECTNLCVFVILQMIATYSCKRKSAHWPMAVFSAMIDMSAINAFVGWKEINPAWERGKCFQRRLFLEQLGKALVSPHMKSRKHLPRKPASVNLLRKMQDPPSDSEEAPGPSIQPPSSKRKRCQVCPRSKDVKSRWHCTCTNCKNCKILSVLHCAFSLVVCIFCIVVCTLSLVY